MKKTLLWILFVIFLVLIISPVDFIPDVLPGGHIDDVAYGILDVIIVAFLTGLRKKKALPPGKGESAVPDGPK